MPYRHNKMHMVRTSKKRHAYRDSSSALVLAKAKIELDKKVGVGSLAPMDGRRKIRKSGSSLCGFL